MVIHFQGTAAIIAGKTGIWLQLSYEARENAKIMIGDITSNFWEAMEHDQLLQGTRLHAPQRGSNEGPQRRFSWNTFL